MSHLYMKLYSPQGQQYYTAVDNNNKKKEKKQRLTILQYKYSSVAALYHCELEYILCNVYLLKFDELVLQSEQLMLAQFTKVTE